MKASFLTADTVDLLHQIRALEVCVAHCSTQMASPFAVDLDATILRALSLHLNIRPFEYFICSCQSIWFDHQDALAGLGVVAICRPFVKQPVKPAPQLLQLITASSIIGIPHLLAVWLEAFR